MKDEELLILLKSQDYEKGIQKLYTHLTSVKRFVIRHGGNADEAFDLFQDSLLVFIEKVRNADFQLNASIQTYLFSICKYKWKQILLTKNKQSKYFQDLEYESDFIQNEEKETLFLNAEKAFFKLGEKCQELLVTFYHAKFNMSQIAEKFGYASENVAKTQKYKCLEKAREEYQLLVSNS